MKFGTPLIMHIFEEFIGSEGERKKKWTKTQGISGNIQ